MRVRLRVVAPLVHLDVEHRARVLDQHLGLVGVLRLDVEVLREAAGKHAPGEG